MRKNVLPSDLGDLQAFGVKDKDLNTIERALNARQKVEIEELKIGSSRPTTCIYIEGVLLTKIEGY